jgi:hypothetical protein
VAQLGKHGDIKIFPQYIRAPSPANLLFPERIPMAPLNPSGLRLTADPHGEPP